MAKKPKFKIQGERYYQDYSSEPFPWRMWTMIDGVAVMAFGRTYDDAITNLLGRLDEKGIIKLDTNWDKSDHEWDDNIPIDTGR